MNKTLVALRSCTDSSSFSVAKFANCLAHYFNNDKGKVSVPVQCKLEDNLLKLSPIQDTCPSIKSLNTELYVWDEVTNTFTSPANIHNVVLHHSRECPIGNLSEADKENLPLDVQNRGIDVAVAILLESKDKRVLMTRRPSHMRTFPRAWVPPGGHIEMNETLIDAALRELKEETGIMLGTSTTFQVFCLWESVYPFILGLGLPSRHHVVVYLLAKSDLTSDQWIEKMKLDPEEVDSCAWMTPESIRYIMSACSEPTQPSQVMYSPSPEGNLKPKPMTLSSMFHKELWGNGEIFSGSQLALVVWYESLKKSNAKL